LLAALLLFDIDQVDGHLTYRASVPCAAHYVTSLTLNPAGTLAFLGHYAAHGVTSVKLDPVTGTMSPPGVPAVLSQWPTSLAVLR
jgi:hypothetical protein